MRFSSLGRKFLANLCVASGAIIFWSKSFVTASDRARSGRWSGDIRGHWPTSRY